MTSQVVLNGVVAGLTWGLVALGFTVVYRTARFLHAAHAATFLMGAYVGVWLTRVTMLPVFVCALGACGAAAMLGIAIEILVYRPLRRAKSSPSILFLASLVLVIIVENTIATVFGSEIQVAGSHSERPSILVGSAQITMVQLGSSLTGLGLFFATWLVIAATPLGKQMRAVACDPELAHIVGMRVSRILAVAMLLGSAVAGVSGFLVAYDTAATPSMGFAALLIGITAAIAGGIGSLPGAMLGGLLVGLSQHIGACVLSPKWQDGVVFVILILFLLLRPHGFFGRSLRTASV